MSPGSDPIGATYAEPDELVVQHDPREQVNKGHVRREQGHDVGGVEDAERVHVHPISADPQQAEQAASSYKIPCV